MRTVRLQVHRRAVTYEGALRYISDLQGRGWRLDLDRIEGLVRYLGLEDFVAGREGCRFLHVAGTNGKGSVTAFLQSILVEAGHRTGAFFSPYVVDPRERIQLGRDLISKSLLAESVASLAPRAEAFARETVFGGVTEFEFKTALAFEIWRKAGCDWVAVEVGLGGRLDATNVLTPAGCAIVSIGLDHVRILGSTLGEIAWEKAGILKRGIPCAVGEMAPEARSAIEAVAQRVGAPLWVMDREIMRRPNGAISTPKGSIGPLEPGLVGSWQAHNAALAASVAALAGAAGADAIVRGVALATAPGRFQVEEVEGRTVVLDGAHNGPAAKGLSRTIAERFPFRGIRLVTNMLEGHDPLEFYRELPRPEGVYLAPIDFFRAVDPQETGRRLAELGWKSQAFETTKAALRAALDQAGANEIVLVTGSNYLVGEAILALRGE